MQQVNEHPLVAVLLRIAREAPNPWFFRAGMERTPEAEQQVAALVEVLEVLHREGLVARHAAPSPLVGPGVSLTEKGRKAVLDPEARRKLAEGEPLDPNDVGSRVRASVRGSLTPWLTRALVLASVGAFVTGGVFAWSRGFFQAFLTGYPSSNLDFYRYLTLLNQMGSMNGKALLDGQWWRMGASSFLHLGGLHLLMNMWALWNIGSFVERVLGRWKLLAIYVLGAWGCSCMAMAMTPGRSIEVDGAELMSVAIGASGAVCGLLGGLAVWTLLVSHHLPAEMARSLRTQMIINGVMMVIISLMPGVSAWGHAGGALGGVMAGITLHYASYGSRIARPLGLAGLPGAALLCFFILQSVREASEPWALLESQHFRRNVAKQVDHAEREAARKFGMFGEPGSRTARALLRWRPEGREQKDVEEAVSAMKEPIEDLEALQRRMKSPAPYRSRVVRKVMALGDAYVTSLLGYYRESVRALQAGAGWSREDEKRRIELSEKMTTAFQAWVEGEKDLPSLKKERGR